MGKTRKTGLICGFEPRETKRAGDTLIALTTSSKGIEDTLALIPDRWRESEVGDLRC
jgi:hypothetical protein